MTHFRTDAAYVRSPEILATELDDEAVLLSIEKQCYFGLPATSRRIWQLLEAPQSVASLVTKLTDEYEVDAAACSRDVVAFLTELSQENLIKVAE